MEKEKVVYIYISETLALKKKEIFKKGNLVAWMNMNNMNEHWGSLSAYT